MAREGPTARELDRAKNSIRASFLDRLASVNSKADVLNTYNYLAGTPDYARRDAARYDAVTAADVQRVARQYLTAHKVVLTIVPAGQRALAVGGAAATLVPGAAAGAPSGASGGAGAVPSSGGAR